MNIVCMRSREFTFYARILSEIKGLLRHGSVGDARDR